MSTHPCSLYRLGTDVGASPSSSPRLTLLITSPHLSLPSRPPLCAGGGTQSPDRPGTKGRDEEGAQVPLAARPPRPPGYRPIQVVSRLGPPPPSLDGVPQFLTCGGRLPPRRRGCRAINVKRADISGSLRPACWRRCWDAGCGRLTAAGLLAAADCQLLDCWLRRIVSCWTAGHGRLSAAGLLATAACQPLDWVERYHSDDG